MTVLCTLQKAILAVIVILSFIWAEALNLNLHSFHDFLDLFFLSS
jgi:hypothetical protein